MNLASSVNNLDANTPLAATTSDENQPKRGILATICAALCQDDQLDEETGLSAGSNNNAPITSQSKELAFSKGFVDWT